MFQSTNPFTEMCQRINKEATYCTHAHVSNEQWKITCQPLSRSVVKNSAVKVSMFVVYVFDFKGLELKTSLKSKLATGVDRCNH